MNSEDTDDSSLPEGWIVCASKSGRKYYFNRKTGSSLWTKPQPKDGQIKESKNQRKKRKEKERAKSQTQKKAAESPRKDLKRKSSDDMKNVTNTPRESQNEGLMSPPTKRKPPKNKKITEYKIPISPIQRTDAQSATPNKSFTTSSPMVAGSSESPMKKSSLSILKRSLSASPNVALTSPLSSSSSNKSVTHPQLSKVMKKKKKKNIANERLSHLRANLSAELVSESQNETTNTSHTSQETNNSNCDISENLHSVPHPSQFFAANKIICSMKAQLPEKYEKERQKDTFADIEKGISNQTAEYPYMKHPVTPPQFSEASNLLSSLKSKLSHQSCKSKEPPAVNKSANDRLQGLRSRISNEVSHDKGISSYEAMDVDIKEVQAKHNIPVQGNTKDNIVSKENVVLVVDTNIFIHELELIKNVMNSHIKGYSQPPTLLVPWRVVNELDNLKDSNNGKGAVCKRARPAMDYLYKSLPESDRIKVQPLRDANSHIYPCESPDDEILNCCLQQAERGKSVILLSNDKNLCTKACANGIPRRSLSEFTLVAPAQQPRVKHQLCLRLQNCIYTLLSNILENEMRAKYDHLWLHVVAKVPPWTLADVLKCLLKHWIAVFREVFPRIEHLFTELSHSLEAIEKNAPNNITQSQLQSFKELCLETAKRCQIIPEYMELAKTTVAKLQKDDGDDDESGDESTVIEAFEGVWTVYSSYCAKLSSLLGVSHSLEIEDKMPSNDSTEDLTSKLDMFGTQITVLSQAIQQVLQENQSPSKEEESIEHLEGAFKESLTAVGMNAATVNANNLKLFSTKCRLMLQEAHGKFSQLLELLQICKKHCN